MTVHKQQIACPLCHKKNTWHADNPFRPFCSERCKSIDLGEWASENRRVPGESVEPNQPKEDDEE